MTSPEECIPKEELIAAAMRVWEQGVIEAALGDDAARVLPEAIRLVLLRVRVPRYQRDMLVALAHAEELAAAVPVLTAALAWPAQA
jgi:hypothetical protein